MSPRCDLLREDHDGTAESTDVTADELQRAVAELEKLPPPAQNEAAARIQQIAAELAEHRWEELQADPRSVSATVQVCVGS